MYSEQGLIALLKEMGFTEYEAAAYAILIIMGPLPAVDVADLTKIPRPRVYDVLNKLIQKGILIMQPGKPTRYKAIHPKDLVEIIEKQQVEKLSNLRKISKEFLKKAKPLYEKRIHPGDLSWVINGKENLKKYIKDLLLKFEEIRGICDSEKSIILTERSLLNILKRKRAFFLLEKTPKAKGLDKLKYKILKFKDDAGILIFDDSAAFILSSQTQDEYYDTGILIRDSRICSTLRSIFDFLWNSS